MSYKDEVMYVCWMCVATTSRPSHKYSASLLCGSNIAVQEVIH